MLFSTPAYCISRFFSPVTDSFAQLATQLRRILPHSYVMGATAMQTRRPGHVPLAVIGGVLLSFGAEIWVAALTPAKNPTLAVDVAGSFWTLVLTAALVIGTIAGVRVLWGLNTALLTLAVGLRLRRGLSGSSPADHRRSHPACDRVGAAPVAFDDALRASPDSHRDRVAQAKEAPVREARPAAVNVAPSGVAAASEGPRTRVTAPPSPATQIWSDRAGTTR